MTKETTNSRATPTAEQAARRGEAHQDRKTALRNAATNCMSNGAGRKARP